MSWRWIWNGQQLTHDNHIYTYYRVNKNKEQIPKQNSNSNSSEQLLTFKKYIYYISFILIRCICVTSEFSGGNRFQNAFLNLFTTLVFKSLDIEYCQNIRSKKNEFRVESRMPFEWKHNPIFHARFYCQAIQILQNQLRFRPLQFWLIFHWTNWTESIYFSRCHQFTTSIEVDFGNATQWESTVHSIQKSFEW